ncbi:hypothetical protein E2C01_046469 [Portunus trituberculatus]|uniref:Uncharacterized protein n=1 Tax=Portunus trituberculatus TaxID=210409 RepID=A0A5B7G4Z4_PORTR|nr:hypothetical protein [Portunus trituberculatus]
MIKKKDCRPQCHPGPMQGHCFANTTGQSGGAQDHLRQWADFQDLHRAACQRVFKEPGLSEEEDIIGPRWQGFTTAL